MQPFSICCTTCKARLRVREEAALGQILACPKCGSMVLVTPPAENFDAADSSASLSSLGNMAASYTLAANFAAITPAAPQFDDIDDLMADDPPAAHAPAPEMSITAAAIAAAIPVAAPVVELPRVVAKPAPPKSAPPPIAPKPAPVPVAAEPVAPTLTALAVAPPEVNVAPAPGPASAIAPVAVAPAFSITTLLANGWVKQWAILGGSITAGIVLAIAVVGVLIAGSGSATPDSAAVAAIETPAAVQPAVQHAPTQPAPLPAMAALSAPQKPASQKQVSAPPTAPNANDLEVDSGPKTAPAPKPAAPAVAESAPPAAPSAAPAPAVVEHVARAEPAAKPSVDDLAPVEKPAVKSAVAADGLGEFSKFLLDNHAPEITAKSAAPPADARLDEVSQSRPPPRKIDLAARLGDPIAAIDLPGIGLADFAQLLSDMSTVPITIDPWALQQLGLSSETTLVVKQANTTVSQVLSQTLKTVGLTFVAEDGHVRIVRPAPVGGLLRRVRYDVSDLVADDPQVITWLAQLLPQFIAPASWTAGGGSGKLAVEGSALVVEQSDAVHFQNLLLIEKVRLARGKAQRSRVSPALLKLEPAAQRAAAKLAQPLSLNYIRPTRLTQVLARVHETTGMRVLVDWPAVYEANWGLNADTRVAISGESAAQALDKLLHPMDLAWRVIDENTLQVSTERALAAQPELALFNMRAALAAGKQTPEKLIERLRAKFGAAAQFAYDPGSQYLLAMLPAPQHEQLRTSLADLAGK